MVSKDTTNYDGGLNSNFQGSTSAPVILDKESYTSGQSARILGIPSRTMRHYLANGKIPGDQNPITGTWQVSRESLTLFLARAGRQVAPGLLKSKIVIVDGDPKLEGFVRKALGTSMPADSIIAPQSICESLIQIGAHKPSLIIIELKMQMFSGSEIVSAIKRTQKNGATKILVVGGASERNEDMEALGVDGMIASPFSYQEFGAELARIIPELSSSMTS